MRNKNFVPALGYSWLTEYFDLSFSLTMPERTFRRKLVDEINPQNGEKILSLGFGTAQNLILAKQRNENSFLYGLEIDPQVKKIAEKKILRANQKIELFLYDGGKFPFADNSFDKVFSSLVFHHLNADTKKHSLRELHRVLKPNGELIIGDFGKPRSSILRFTYFWVQIIDGFETTIDNVRGKLPEMISEAGFADAKEVDFVNSIIGTISYYKAKK